MKTQIKILKLYASDTDDVVYLNLNLQPDNLTSCKTFLILLSCHCEIK